MVWSASIPQRRTTNLVGPAPETKAAKTVTDQQEFSHRPRVLDNGFTSRVYGQPGGWPAFFNSIFPLRKMLRRRAADGMSCPRLVPQATSFE